MIVDDELHVRLMVKALLTSMNLEVVGEASNGQQAVELYREKRPELALMDLNMPIKTGEEALKEIISEFPDAKVIMLTSMTDLESVEKTIELGASGYIRKDCPLSEIKAMIQDVINPEQ
jgi:two-component system, chemotaxis family, chemotaxis protein CheY